MNDLFAPPGNDWQPVSGGLARMRRTLLAGLAAVLLLAVVVAGLLWLSAWLWLGLVVLVLALAGWAWVIVGRNARSWGYAERAEELYITHGVMFRKLVVVPYGRMQFVDVHAGPVEQVFGLASVHLHTASPGTSARIPGLPEAEASRLRDRLTSLGEAQAAGL